MAFASALQAGTFAGLGNAQAAIGPLAQALDPLRRLQAKNLSLVIEERKQGIDFFNKMIAEAGSQAAVTGDPLIQGALEYAQMQKALALDPSRQQGFVGPPTPINQVDPRTFLSQPTPNAPWPRQQDPLEALGAARGAISDERQQAQAQQAEQLRQSQRQKVLEILQIHPEFGPNVLQRLQPSALQSLLDMMIDTGQVDQLQRDVLGDVRYSPIFGGGGRLGL